MNRRGYKTACRFLRNASTISEIRWIEALPDAATLPYASVILSNDLERAGDREWPVGEVLGSPRPFFPNKVPIGYDGSHPCGAPIDFEQGGDYRPDLPLAQYDADGFLLCCTGPKKVHGGAGAGGRAVVLVLRPLTRPGGAGAGGHVVPSYSEMVDPTEGGVEFGGEVPEVFSAPSPTEGGVEIGGESGDVLTPVVTASPGPSCSTAQEVVLGTVYAYVSPGETSSSQWYHWSVPDGTYYLRTIRFAVVGGTNGLCYETTDCATLNILTLVTTSCVDVHPSLGTGVFFRVLNFGPAVSVPYNFQLSTDPCPA